MKAVTSSGARHVVTAVCVLGLVACNRSDSKGDDVPSAATAIAHLDTSGGEVSQYSLMSSPVGWLTDSNLVALASLVNDAPMRLARPEAQQSTSQQVRDFAVQVVRDHAALQAAIDSLSAKRRIPSQRPAIAASMQMEYDSTVAQLAGSSPQAVDATFLALEQKVHERTLSDFGALAGNATDPDLRAALAVRATDMEQRHLALGKQVAASLAQADSAKAAKQGTPANRKP